MISLKDSKGDKSKTLAFVTVSWCIVSVRMLLAGMDLTRFGLGAAQPISLTEYATAVAAILAIWLGREWMVEAMIPQLYLYGAIFLAGLAAGAGPTYKVMDWRCKAAQTQALQVTVEAQEEARLELLAAEARGDKLSADLSKAYATIRKLRDSHEDYAQSIDGQCPGRLRILHDAAALGYALPTTPESLAHSPATFAASALGTALVRNYGTCRENTEQLNALIDWHEGKK